MLKYFLPDSQDLVDPSFDFERETRSADRIRERDDLYAHEVFGVQGRVFDGILVSKAIVDGTGGVGSARFTKAQRRRLLSEGVQSLFRTRGHGWGAIAFMGDCGAFSYIKQAAPPYSVDEVIDFYVRCGFDLGLSVDHVIVAYRPDWDADLFGSAAAPEVRARQEMTIELASAFFSRHVREGPKFVPVGVAQGWSPRSYARVFAALQAIGFRYIALGGVARLKTREILDCLQAIAAVRRPETRIHLLGVGRVSHVEEFTSLGVASVDSTSPLRQAFMDDANNYHTPAGAYSAIRVPQGLVNRALRGQIEAGAIDPDTAREAEGACLRVMAEYAARDVKIGPVLAALRAYEELCGVDRSRVEAYRRTLEDRPWELCSCAVCRALGHHVIVFRGAERNRRRGFHNVGVFYRRLRAGEGQGL